MDFLEHTEIEKKQLDESYKQSLKNKQERYLDSFSNDLKNSIIKKIEKRKTESERLQEELEPLPWCSMSDE
jgi:gas vesicle protein